MGIGKMRKWDNKFVRTFIPRFKKFVISKIFAIPGRRGIIPRFSGIKYCKSFETRYRFIFSRPIIFYSLIVFLSNFIIDYPRLAVIVKVKNLNTIMPKSFLPIMQLANNQQVKADDFYPCFAFYNEINRQFPDQPDDLGMLGFCYYHLGQPLKAIYFYQKAVKLRPDIFWFHFNIGVLFYKEGRYQLAIDSLRKAVASKSVDTLKFIASSGVVYRTLTQEFPDLQYNVPIRLSQGYHDAYVLMVLSHLLLGNFQGMLSAATDAIALNVSGNDLFYYYAGLASYQLKKYDSAVFFLKEALSINDHFGEALYCLGLSLHALGKDEEAQKALQNGQYLLTTQNPSLPSPDKILPRLF